MVFVLLIFLLKIELEYNLLYKDILLIVLVLLLILKNNATIEDVGNLYASS